MRHSLIVGLSAVLIALTGFGVSQPVHAQTPGDPVPSSCVAVAQRLPQASFVSFAPALEQAEDQTVRITYEGHSTYRIDTPGGVSIATDYSGVYGRDPLPDVVTMNKVHRTHYTDTPDPGIGHVFRGWNPNGDGPAKHAEVIDDVYVRNVPTDIRRWDQMERDGNSIFIFEVAGLCIGHLGHLHHDLTDAHYAAIGRLDVVMVPIDGGMTQSLVNMQTITKRLTSSIVLPMHRHSTPLSEFTSSMGEGFALDFRDSRSLDVSLRTLPRQPTIVVLRGI